MAERNQAKIFGEDLQFLEFELNPGEEVFSELSTLLYMGDGIEIQTSSKQGLKNEQKRTFTQKRSSFTTFTNRGNQTSCVAFAASFPGKVIELDLDELGGQFICQKGAFLCATQGVDIEITLTRPLGSSILGDVTFTPQRLSGNGFAYFQVGGTVMCKEMKGREILKVDSSCLVAFSPSISYDFTFVGGSSNSLFTDERKAFAILSGSGLVFIQSLPLIQLANKIKHTSSF